MKLILGGSRAVRAAVLALGAAAVGLAVSAAPALALAPSHAQFRGRGVAVPLHASGGLSLASLVALIALVAAIIAIGVIGWGRDQRNVALAQSRRQRTGSPSGAGGSGQESWEARKPSASKPLATRTPVEVRARRDQSERRPGRLDEGLTREQKSWVSLGALAVCCKLQQTASAPNTVLTLP